MSNVFDLLYQHFHEFKKACHVEQDELLHKELQTVLNSLNEAQQTLLVQYLNHALEQDTKEHRAAFEAGFKMGMRFSEELNAN